MRVALLKFRTPAVAVALAAGAMVFALAGCGSPTFPTVQAPPSGPGVSFGGKAMVGGQPLIGASIQVYAAGSSGNGSSASALLSAALPTDANGAFTVSAGYTCPSSSSQIYAVARGGKPGAAASSANSAVVLLTVLGTCGQIAASSQIVMNEVTTVAATYALSQFLSTGANLGAGSTNAVGLRNAVATAQALADVTAGTSPGPSFATNGSSPAAQIDSIANLLNACAAASPNASACTSLFAATTPAGGNAPSNIMDAALNLARNPAQNVAGIYTLSTGSSAFAPALAAAPADWTLFVNYTGGGMNSPESLGVDSAGNVWVASYWNVASLFSPLGVPLFPQGITGFGLSASFGLAIDANDDAWITNQPNYNLALEWVSGNSVDVFDSSGQSVAGSGGYTGGGLDLANSYPTAVAIDTDGSAWVVDFGDSSLTHLSSSGQGLSGASGYTSSQLAFPVALAIDGSHNVWVSNQSGGSVSKVSPDGSQFTSYACCNSPSTLAIDRHGNVWVTNYAGDSISEISSAGTIISNGYTGGGLSHPQGIAIDGAGNVWIANYRGPALTELAGADAATPGAALSPSNGFGSDAALLEAYAIAVDASGNLWVSNAGIDTAHPVSFLTEFVGMAAPVKTPLISLPVAP